MSTHVPAQDTDEMTDGFIDKNDQATPVFTTPITPTKSSRSGHFGRTAYLIAGVLLGALIILGIRFGTYHHDMVHYHANFAVYIDGQREAFNSPQYYEEIKLCDLHGTTPQSRTHMHAHESGVIHVHDTAVTWGAFFENLGWVVGSDFIHTKTTLYQTAGTDKKLNIVLNGQDLTDLTSITNEVIADKDRLLISYGSADQTVLSREYKTVPDTAALHDVQKDPASCGGSESTTIKDRFQNLF